jgi:hypothetical protein
MLKYKIPQIVTLTQKKMVPKKKRMKYMGIKKGVPLYSNLC